MEIRTFDEELNDWPDVLESAIDIAQDPYKAPELIIASLKPLLEATWRLQISYQVALEVSRVTHND